MDQIYLNEMEFYGYHGVLKEETAIGQRFIVDIAAGIDLKPAGETDNLDATVNYADLFFLCKEIVEGKPYKLIEAVAEEISSQILNRFEKIQTCTVKITKPDPPIPGHYKSVAVEITRSK